MDNTISGWMPNYLILAGQYWAVEEGWLQSFEIYHSHWLSQYKP